MTLPDFGHAAEIRKGDAKRIRIPLPLFPKNRTNRPPEPDYRRVTGLSTKSNS